MLPIRLSFLRLSAPSGEGWGLHRPGQILENMNPQLLDGGLDKEAEVWRKGLPGRNPGDFSPPPLF